MHLPVAKVREQVSLHVEALPGGFIHLDLRPLRLQQHQLSQRFRVGHVEIIASQNAQANRVCRRGSCQCFLKIGHQQA